MRGAMKSWNYDEITKHAEKEIKSIMKQRETADPRIEDILAAWAYGVYLSWNGLTMGWQNIGDRTLEALSNRQSRVHPNLTVLPDTFPLL